MARGWSEWVRNKAAGGGGFSISRQLTEKKKRALPMRDELKELQSSRRTDHMLPVCGWPSQSSPLSLSLSLLLREGERKVVGGQSKETGREWDSRTWRGKKEGEESGETDTGRSEVR